MSNDTAIIDVTHAKAECGRDTASVALETLVTSTTLGNEEREAVAHLVRGLAQVFFAVDVYQATLASPRYAEPGEPEATLVRDEVKHEKELLGHLDAINGFARSINNRTSGTSVLDGADIMAHVRECRQLLLPTEASDEPHTEE